MSRLFMKRARLTEVAANGLLGAATVLVLVPLVGIFAVLLVRGAPLFTLPFITEPPRNGLKDGGIMPAALGTLLLMLGTAVLSLPVGVAAAVYLREFAPDTRVTRLIRLAILNLAGVPSVVHGLFGLGIFVLLCGFGGSLLASWCTLALLVLPTVITASEEALRAVPDTLREASDGLGATKRQTIVKVVLPAALPGILTGAILAMGRAAGETAPILFTGVAFFCPEVPRGVFDQFMALSYHLYVTSTQVPNVPPALPYATAAILIQLVLATSAVAIVVRARFRKRALT